MLKPTLLVLLLVGVALAEEKYPLTLKILETTATDQLAPVRSTASTDCTTDAFGKTNCDTTAIGGVATHTVQRQIAEATDGNTYTLQCAGGAWWQRFSMGAGAAMQGGASTSGCMISPGAYKAKRTRSGFRLLVYDFKNKPHEISVAVLAVKPTAK